MSAKTNSFVPLHTPYPVCLLCGNNLKKQTSLSHIRVKGAREITSSSICPTCLSDVTQEIGYPVADDWVALELGL
jgi:hypothetical protein